MIRSHPDAPMALTRTICRTKCKYSQWRCVCFLGLGRVTWLHFRGLARYEASIAWQQLIHSCGCWSRKTSTSPYSSRQFTNRETDSEAQKERLPRSQARILQVRLHRLKPRKLHTLQPNASMIIYDRPGGEFSFRYYTT